MSRGPIRPKADDELTALLDRAQRLVPRYASRLHSKRRSARKLVPAVAVLVLGVERLLFRGVDRRDVRRLIRLALRRSRL
jgi:hypothetical protein